MGAAAKSILGLIVIAGIFCQGHGAGERLGQIIEKKGQPQLLRPPRDWAFISRRHSILLGDQLKNEISDAFGMRLDGLAPFLGLGACMDIKLEDKGPRRIGLKLGQGAIRLLIEKGSSITATTPSGEQVGVTGTGFAISCEPPGSRCRMPDSCDSAPQLRQPAVAAETTAPDGCIFVGVYGTTTVKYGNQEVTLLRREFAGVQRGQPLQKQEMDEACFRALEGKTTPLTLEMPPRDHPPIPDASPMPPGCEADPACGNPDQPITLPRAPFPPSPACPICPLLRVKPPVH